MPDDCHCQAPHGPPRRVVLTGGPGAGKTAVLEIVRRHLCRHVLVLPESASILFSGGFPRWEGDAAHRHLQRAIFHVQRELEALHDTHPDVAVALCDRGTVDGAAYWPGTPDTFFAAVGTTREAELARYATVIHLRVPPVGEGYGHQNPNRRETAAQAHAIDLRIEEIWRGHPRRYFVESTADFLAKARTAIGLIRTELPACCRNDVDP